MPQALAARPVEADVLRGPPSAEQLAAGGEHLAMLDSADDPAAATTWLEHVTDDQYLA
jgi:hypothetical protein